MDNGTIALIATGILTVVAVLGGGAIFLRSSKIGKEAVDVAAAALQAVVDMNVSAEEVAAVRKEWEEFKAALKKKESGQ